MTEFYDKIKLRIQESKTVTKTRRFTTQYIFDDDLKIFEDSVYFQKIKVPFITRSEIKNLFNLAKEKHRNMLMVKSDQDVDKLRKIL